MSGVEGSGIRMKGKGERDTEPCRIVGVSYHRYVYQKVVKTARADPL